MNTCWRHTKPDSPPPMTSITTAARPVSRSAFIRICFTAFLLFSGMPAAAQAQAWSLDALLHGFARVGESTAHYTETRQSGFVDVPLITEGTLVYRAPDYLAKHDAGGGSGYTVQGDSVEALGPQGRKRSLRLDNYPTLAAFIAALRATLAGDGKTLHAYFKTRLKGDRAHWTLELTPADAGLANYVSAITLKGSGIRLDEVEMQEVGGDTSVLKLSHQVLHERPASAG
jgi:hypothetical protein